MKVKEQEVVLTPKNVLRVARFLKAASGIQQIDVTGRGIKVTYYSRNLRGEYIVFEWLWGRSMQLLGFEKV